MKDWPISIWASELPMKYDSHLRGTWIDCCTSGHSVRYVRCDVVSAKDKRIEELEAFVIKIKDSGGPWMSQARELMLKKEL